LRIGEIRARRDGFFEIDECLGMATKKKMLSTKVVEYIDVARLDEEGLRKAGDRLFVAA